MLNGSVALPLVDHLLSHVHIRIPQSVGGAFSRWAQNARSSFIVAMVVSECYHRTCFKSSPDLDRTLTLLVMRILVRLMRADSILVDAAATTTSTGKSTSLEPYLLLPSPTSLLTVYFNGGQKHPC